MAMITYTSTIIYFFGLSDSVLSIIIKVFCTFVKITKLDGYANFSHTGEF